MAVPNNDASTTTLAATAQLVLSPKRQWGGGEAGCCSSRHFFKAGCVDTSAWFGGSAIITTVKTTFAVVSCSFSYIPYCCRAAAAILSWTTHKRLHCTLICFHRFSCGDKNDCETGSLKKMLYFYGEIAKQDNGWISPYTACSERY